ncbi:TetR/AcrR family transcriptional regulator [Bacillus sp. PS06]|uniref:TetR/AcrR family transcriptional regulator n=1 Tax=Bacillus sp. PS06 TaxID=2764176 RepID=UPI001784A57B|nr:TetR/AcrR family transcriptional regulator [Bacillus sp. PS06]MBD8070831.1 TetR/AcrR family transcriptional regulator [Bacillus sp. PS06]
MKEKDKVIIETAIKLFAQKGYTTTSIQEIAAESGISKGAFYLHFKSKDALMLAILEYYYEKLQSSIFKNQDSSLEPKEKFAQELIALLNSFLEHKEFFIMQSREQAIPINDAVKAFILKMHEESHDFYQDRIKSIYGKNIERYLWDLSMILDGLLHSYIRLLLFGQSQFQTSEIIHFILKRLDDIAQGITADKPLMSTERIESIMAKTKNALLNEEPTIDKLLTQLRKQIGTIDANDDLLVSLEVLEAEINKESPRLPVIQGMLSNFTSHPQLDNYRKEIAALYDVKI